MLYHDKEICTITVEMNRSVQPDWAPELEDCVKEAWHILIPLFTRRHGNREGRLSINENSVVIQWRYEEIEESSTGAAGAKSPAVVAQ